MSELDNRQFIRVAEALIYPKADTSKPATLLVPVDALVVKTRISFSIKKTSEGTTNKATINLFNLSERSRIFLEDPNNVILLKAGFARAADITRLFFGDVVRKSDSRDGPDVITSLECGDTEKLLQKAHIEVGLAPGARLSQLVNIGAQALGLTPARLEGIRDQVFKNGFSFSGTVQGLFDLIVSNSGSEWNIQDQELQFLTKNGPTQLQAVVLSPESGLLGWPTKTKDGLQVDALLQPTVLPGRLVQIVSKQYLGSFGAGTDPGSRSLEQSGGFMKAKVVKHDGDTLEGSWNTNIEGTTLGVSPITAAAGAAAGALAG